MKPRYVWFSTAQKKKGKKKLLQSSYERNSPPKMPVTAAKNKLISEEEERTLSKKGSVHWSFKQPIVHCRRSPPLWNIQRYIFEGQNNDQRWQQTIHHVWRNTDL